MSSNKRAKEALIRLYGSECFIDKLKLRPPDDPPKHYKGKGQLKRMKQLTYHHIKMKKDGGKATVENGALLSAENHQWFHKQPLDKQAEMNQKFQDYKACNVEFTDDAPELELDFSVDCAIGDIDEKGHIEIYNRAKVKRETEKLIKEYERGNTDDYR